MQTAAGPGRLREWASRPDSGLPRIIGADKSGGTMDALQHGVDAGDLHQWEGSLR